MNKNDIDQTKKMANDTASFAKNVASGNVLGAAKDAINLLKNEKFRKMLLRNFIIAITKIILIFTILFSIVAGILGIFTAIRDAISGLIGKIGNFISSAWTWVIDDYWIDINEEVTITDEDGTEKTQTIVDHYIDRLDDLGISLKDLRLLGDADYSDPNLLEDENNKKQVQKYISEFVKADIMSQEFHRQNRGDALIKSTDPNSKDSSKIDGGVYIYRTKNEVDTEGTIKIDDSNSFRMKFTEYDEFIKYSNLELADYDKAKEMFTVDPETQELLFYSIDQYQDYNYIGYDEDDTDKKISKDLRPYKTTLTIQRANYKSLIEKYAMPFEFLVDLCMITQNPEFVYHVAHLARNTNIQLIILDAIDEEQIISETEGRSKVYIGTPGEKGYQVLSENGKTSLGESEYFVKTVTPKLVVAQANTWSYSVAYQYINKITAPEPEVTKENLEDINTYIQVTLRGGATGTATKTYTEMVKTTTKTHKTNEYKETIVYEHMKSKQFLGLLRNSTGRCVDTSDVLNCANNAAFNKKGINVAYKIPNSTIEEMPLNKLQSGEQMLYSLLETNVNSITSYNEKMQGLKEYMQYIMTFPEEDWKDVLPLLPGIGTGTGTDGETYEGVTSGMFWWPLDPSADVKITSVFGEREAPLPGASTNHKAIDIGVVSGTDVLASAAGIVEYVGYDEDGYGNYVTIDHQNGFKTRYAHNSEVLVKKGDTVTRGQVIAKSGSTGNSTGPHLHFEVHLSGTRVDPLLYVSMENKQPQGTVYNLTNEQLKVVYAVVAAECDANYDGALAVISCALNRCESMSWSLYGMNDPYKQITFPGQFIAYGGEQYNDYINGRKEVPSYVQDAVNYALSGGNRNHNYTNFRTTSDSIKTEHPSGKDIGGNWYYE